MPPRPPHYGRPCLYIMESMNVDSPPCNKYSGYMGHGQGRSCKQICWPPGFGGLQRVGLDPGQYDHHPHGVVHVGQLQDVQTVFPVVREAHLGLITVSSSVMQFCNLLLFSTQEPGVKSWVEPLPRLVELASVISVFVMRGRARKAWGLRIAIFIIIVFDPSNP